MMDDVMPRLSNITQHRILSKVQKDYDAIAEEFDETRHRPWPEFEECLKVVRKRHAGQIIKLLDAGCGNGRLLAFLKAQDVHMKYVGIDANTTLLALAAKKNPRAKFLKGNILRLPFRSHSFDTVWCIAVIHHLPSKAYHLKAIQELRRVVQKNGTAVLTVWNLWQPKYKKFIHTATRHALVPWKKGLQLKRFYYAFRKTELQDILTEGGLKVIKKIQSGHNFVFICSPSP